MRMLPAGPLLHRATAKRNPIARRLLAHTTRRKLNLDPATIQPTSEPTNHHPAFPTSNTTSITTTTTTKNPFNNNPILPKMATPLPPLPEITPLHPKLTRILASNPSKFTLQGTNTYLLGAGATRLLIDTGEGKPAWLSALKSHLAAENATLLHVLLTHRHHDHVGGVADVRAAWPGATVWKCEPEDGEQEIVDGARWHLPEAQVTLRAVHTPGHTSDHMCFVWEEEGAVFTGDNVLGHGTSVFEDLGAYVASLERMRGLFAGEGGTTGRAYPGHGEVVEDGRGRVEEYIRHRAQREEQVVQTLRGRGQEGVETTSGAGGGGDGSWAVMELVASIYRDVPESLHPAAAGGVVQILQKLLREGKAVMEGDGERWRLTGSGRSAL